MEVNSNATKEEIAEARKQRIVDAYLDPKPTMAEVLAKNCATSSSDNIIENAG